MMIRQSETLMELSQRRSHTTRMTQMTSRSPWSQAIDMKGYLHCEKYRSDKDKLPPSVSLAWPRHLYKEMEVKYCWRPRELLDHDLVEE